MRHATYRTLKANIHRPSEKLPSFYDNSRFFQYAQRVEKIEKQLVGFISSQRTPFTFSNSPELAMFRGEKTRGNMLTVTVNLPGFPKGVALPRIFVLDTPENNAMSIGRFAFNAGKELTFQLPRYHTGVAAQDDMAQAMWQAAQIPPLARLTRQLQDPASQMYLIYITREGHLTDWHRAVYYQSGYDIPFTIVHAEHSPGFAKKSQFQRITKICPINREGLIPSQTSVLIVADNTAAGMQHVAVLEEMVRVVKSQNNGGHVLTHVLIVSPLLNYYAASIIGWWLAEQEGLPTTFVASGVLLGCNPPDRYFCPVLAESKLASNPKLIAVNHEAHGVNAAGRACVRCNWTASFLAPMYQMARSKEELQLYGASDDELLANSQKITPSSVRRDNVDPAWLVPYSTWRTAVRLGRLRSLKRVIS